jgi:hypothetical protein
MAPPKVPHFEPEIVEETKEKADIEPKKPTGVPWGDWHQKYVLNDQ